MFQNNATDTEMANETSCENSRSTAHSTVTGANETGVDLVFIRPFLLYYVNYVVVMLTIIFSAKFP